MVEKVVIKKMKKLFLFPTEMEAERFRAAMPDAEVRISGVGAAETAVATSNALREGYRDLVLAGIAGTYDETFESGTTVAVSEERAAGLPSTYLKSYTANYVPKGLPAVVSNTVAECGAAADGAQIENMEGAVFFALCRDAGVRYCEIRSISNKVGASRDDWQVDTALENLTKILVKIVSKEKVMNKTKIIMYAALAVIVVALAALIVYKWDVWVRTAATWVLIIAVSFCAGWLLGRFGSGRKKKDADRS